VFIEAEKFSKVMVCYENALEWQELFDLVLRENTSDGDIVSIGYRVAEDLSSKKRYSEAARVLLDYPKDVRQAVIALVQGNKFSEARRIVSTTEISRVSPLMVSRYLILVRCNTRPLATGLLSLCPS